MDVDIASRLSPEPIQSLDRTDLSKQKYPRKLLMSPPPFNGAFDLY